MQRKIRAIKKDSTEAFQEYNIKNELIEKLQKENVNLKIQLLKNNATFLKKHLEIVSCENFSLMNKQKIKEKSLVVNNEKINFSCLSPRFFLENGLNVVLIKSSSYMPPIFQLQYLLLYTLQFSISTANYHKNASELNL